MITRSKDAKVVQPVDGILRRMVACGEKCQIIEFRLRKGAKIPSHKHPHEQIGFVGKGKFRISVAGEESVVGEGDGYSIKPNVEHSVDVLEDSVAIDVFSPPREDFMDK
ncbi:MAG: cupin domain-containing protein [Euryarchaeota archaeon]|nr:cupin domain-containing protein [Euryarchaeota archaeon]